MLRTFFFFLLLTLKSKCLCFDLSLQRGYTLVVQKQVKLGNNMPSHSKKKKEPANISMLDIEGFFTQLLKL